MIGSVGSVGSSLRQFAVECQLSSIKNVIASGRAREKGDQESNTKSRGPLVSYSTSRVETSHRVLDSFSSLSEVADERKEEERVNQ